MLGKRATCAVLASFQQSQQGCWERTPAAGDGAQDGLSDLGRDTEDTLSSGMIIWLMSLEGQEN